jgi:hypothetical protein
MSRRPPYDISDDECSIVEEELPSPELVKKAEALQLPKSFYNYQCRAAETVYIDCEESRAETAGAGCCKLYNLLEFN